MELITDPEDERIADYPGLTDAERRTRWEPPHGLFIAEGELVLRRALRAGYRARSYLLDEKRLDQLADVQPPPAPAGPSGRRRGRDTGRSAVARSCGRSLLE